MSTLSKGYTFGATESVTNTKLHNLVDLGSISDIVDADVSASAAIDSSKLDLTSAGYLTTGGNFDVTGKYSFRDLSWLNLSSLASINDARIESAMITSLMSIGEAYANQLDTPLAYIYSLASIANPLHYSAIVASLASGAQVSYDGADRLVGAAASSTTGVEVFTSDGTFTAPAGVTKVYLTMWGAGGGGGGSKDGGVGGGGGAGGSYLINIPYTVVPGNPYDVQVGVGGAGGIQNTGDGGTAGEASIFDATLTARGGDYGRRSGHITEPGKGGVAATTDFDAGSPPSGGTTSDFPSGSGADESGGVGGGGGGTILGSGGDGGATNENGDDAPVANTGAGGGGSAQNGSGRNGGAGSDGLVIVMY